jgi:hypothetical protein
MNYFYILDFANTIWLTFVFIIVLGIIAKPAIYDYISLGVKIFISFFLIYTFNDFSNKHHLTKFDKRVCFMAGMNLLVIAFSDHIQRYSEKLKEIINKIESKIKSNIKYDGRTD